MKSDGNGNLIVKKSLAVWASIITLSVLLISIGFNVSYFTGLGWIKERIIASECKIENNRILIEKNRDLYYKLDRTMARVEALLEKHE